MERTPVRMRVFSQDNTAESGLAKNEKEQTGNFLSALFFYKKVDVRPDYSDHTHFWFRLLVF
jgi:hypothetical protein